MNLLEIKHHFRTVKMTTLSNLCALFNASPEAVRAMLMFFIQKGDVRQCLKKPACGSKCFKCPTESIELYEWISTRAPCF